MKKIISIIALLLLLSTVSDSANLKINRWLGHDLDLNGLYYANAANNTVHDITTQDISISAWVKGDVDATGISQIVVKTGSGGEYWIGYADTNTLAAYYYDDVSNYLRLLKAYPRDNKWHHIAIYFDISEKIGQMFIDGISQGLSTTAIGTITSISNNGIFYIGSSYSSYRWDGQICDVKLYYAAGDHWTDAQILYQATHKFDYTGTVGTTGLLTDYWPCDEGSGLVLNGKVNNLTLSNALAWSTQPKLKITPASTAKTKIATGLVGWWKMDDNAASPTVIDYSGKGNHGTFSDATGDPNTNAHTAAGQVGSAMSFDGVDDYVNAGTGSSLANINNAFTYAVWFKGDNVGAVPGSTVGIVGSYVNGAMLSTYDSRVRFYFNFVITGIVSTTVLQNGVWYYAVATFDGNTARLFINGVQEGSQNKGGNYGSSFGTNYIGRNTSSLSYFNGLIDDVKIYNYARSSEQILQDYNRGLAGRE